MLVAATGAPEAHSACFLLQRMAFVGSSVPSFVCGVRAHARVPQYVLAAWVRISLSCMHLSLSASEPIKVICPVERVHLHTPPRQHRLYFCVAGHAAVP